MEPRRTGSLHAKTITRRDGGSVSGSGGSDRVGLSRSTVEKGHVGERE